MSLMGNVIKTVRNTGYDYWAAYIGGEKNQNRHTQTDVITQ